jgi:hypothetical protein
VGHAAWHLRPLHQRLLDKLKQRPKLFADETTLPVLDPGRGRTKTGQLWAYAADDRPWGGSDPPGVTYVYASDRKAERPITHLNGFKGVLQVDGYAALGADVFNAVVNDFRQVCVFLDARPGHEPQCKRFAATEAMRSAGC